VTKAAVIVQVFACFAIYALIPNLFQSASWARTHPAFLAETRPKTVMIETKAIQEDVVSGRAAALGEKIRRPHVIEPAAIFYERVARKDPADPASPKVGLGRFNAEVWVLSWLGLDFSGFTKAQLMAARFFFDALFPFVLLILLSLVTRPAPKPGLDRFFARIHTPVGPTPEEDAAAVERAYAHPEMHRGRKVWPRSSWEIMKPGKGDLLGFGGSWLLVGVIILLLWLMVSLR
jgi:SSS family solute:Na+ symporter